MASNTASTTPFAEMYVEPAWLEEHLGASDLRVIEVDVSRAAYNQGHIPGAILWNAYADLRHPDYSLLDQTEFSSLLASSGLRQSDTLVFYGYAAYLGFWLLRSYGQKRVLMLNGTRQSWQEAGRLWTTDTPTPAPTVYTLPPEEPARLMSLASVQSAIGTGNPIILDVRSIEEFTGERFWPSGATEGAGRSGHIPGAVHLPIDQFHTPDGGLPNLDALRQRLYALGVVPERGVVTYCTIGNRASEAATILALLEYPDVRVYYGSWAEWGTQADTPVEVC